MDETLVEVKEKAKEAVGRDEDVKILAFLCNWCSYAGADLAGVSRLQYPPNVVDIRVMCTGTISPYFVLKAFQEGIDGVLIAGCHIGDCHYGKGNYATAKRFRLLKDLLMKVGIDPRRIRLEWVSAAEGAKFQELITSFTEQVKAAGKSPLGLKDRLLPSAEQTGISEPLSITVDEDWRPGAAEEALAKSVREALSSGSASAAVVLTVVDRDLVPRLVKSAEDRAIDDLYAGDTRYPMASFAIMLLPLVEGKLAVPVRECDRRMIVELKKHNQIDPDRLVLLGVQCSQAVADACGCGHPSVPEEIAIMDAIASPAEPSPPPETLAEDAGERLDFWMGNFSNCIRCMGCRNICPMCYCTECALDNPDIIGADSKPPDIPIFHLIRAIDMADRCIDCGMCEEICPADIPLRQLYRQAREVVKEAFGYEPGLNPDETSPIKMLGEPANLPNAK